MTNNQIASIGFIVACSILAAFSQSLGAYLCLAVSIALFGFILWLDRNRIDNQERLQTQITALQNRIEAMQISRLVR